MDDQQFLTTILKGIVDFPDEIVVDRTQDDMGVLLLVHANQKDLRYIIGREGGVAMALRKIMKVFGGRHKANINMKIHEPDRPDRLESTPSQF